MNDSMPALKETVQQVLRDFAYLDLEVCAGDVEFQSNWAVCGAVGCGGHCGGTVAIFTTLELAIQAADGLLGTESTSRQQIDTIAELTNVLAGNAYEILCNGLRPAHVTTPKILAPHDARTLWLNAALDCRYVLRSERRIEGGLVVALPREWSQWK